MQKHTPLPALLAAAVFSSTAHAHAGDHNHFSLSALGEHLFGQPFHLLGLAALVGTVAYAGWRLKRRAR